MMIIMGGVTKLDKRGRLVIPAKVRKRIDTSFVEVREEDGKVILIPIPDPLERLHGRLSRAKPLKDLDEAAEEEAERSIKEKHRDADPRG